MTVSRIFWPTPLAPDQLVSIGGEKARYVIRVLRQRVGDPLCVFDGSGPEYAAVISAIGKQELQIEVGSALQRSRESPLSIQLVQAISRGERMDFCVQKATELGVSRISPVASDRSVVRLTEQRASKRREHWLKVAQSACEQCGRNRVPQIDMPISLATWHDLGEERQETRIILSPGQSRSIETLPKPQQGFVLLIGPEGGFSDAEYARAEFAGFEAFSLGPRVLRTETAALAAIAVIQSRFGDLA